MGSLDISGAVAQPGDIRLCPHSTTSYAWHVESHAKALIARQCRNKRCPHCAAILRRVLVARITAARPSTFLTLTSRHDVDLQTALATITRANGRLWPWIRRHYGPAEYVRILEWCRDGYPHLHCLARMPFVPQRAIAAKWRALTGAVVVDIRKAHGRSARYVAKYVAKHTADTSRWTRQTISASRGFFDRDTRPSEFCNWEDRPCHIRDAAARLNDQWALHRLKPGVYWIFDREPGDELPSELQHPSVQASCNSLL